MDDHQALVSSTWDADQTALRDWVDCIVNINNTIAKDQDLDAFRASAASIIQAELEARKGDEHCSLSSVLATVYEKLWFASYCPCKSIPHRRQKMAKPSLPQHSGLPQFQLGLLTRLIVRSRAAFQEANLHLPHLPSVPVLFGQDLDAILEKGKKRCLLQVLCDFVANNYLEPKYAPGTLLNEPVSSQMSLHDVLSLQEAFKRQFQQKTAAAEKAPEASANEISAVDKEQEETHADTEESDSGMEDLEKLAKGDTSGPQRLAEWRAKVLFSKLKTTDSAADGEGCSANQDSALRILREVLITDVGAYKRLRQFIGKHKKTKERKWYCVRTIGLEPGSTTDAERLEGRLFAHCDTCRALKGKICLQIRSSGRGKGEKKLVYATFLA
jgi:hypothetical protein